MCSNDDARKGNMFRQEIGGDFHIDNEIENKEGVSCNIFDCLNDFSVVYFDSGRSALKLLLKHIRHQRILLPGYICESVRNCFPAECEVQYYSITEDIKIDWSDLLSKIQNGVDIVYLHFFNGYIGDEYDFDAILKMKEKYNFTIIEDTTHSIFSSVHTVGDYCICSLRKWFPIADGGVLYSKELIKIEPLDVPEWASIKRDAMIEKAKYLHGKSDNKKHFLAVFSYAEHSLDNQEQPYAISHKSLETLSRIDCSFVINARRKNFNCLNERIKSDVVAAGGKNQVPLFFTIRVNNRDALRKHFIHNNIYCPIHWPLYDELEMISESRIIYSTELSIPIDQRYGEKEMEYICKSYYDFADGRKKK